MDSSTDGRLRSLIARPDRHQRQLWLAGRNMTVGQLIATMRANSRELEEAAVEFDLPIEQAQEALAYYATHRELVDSELREQRTWLLQKGYQVDPP